MLLTLQPPKCQVFLCLGFFHVLTFFLVFGILKFVICLNYCNFGVCYLMEIKHYKSRVRITIRWACLVQLEKNLEV